jgi:hypothetical protein
MATSVPRHPGPGSDRASLRAGTWAALLLGGAALGAATPASAQLNCNVGVEFYPGGAIRSCVLNGHHRFYLAGGPAVTCADGHRLVQFPDGRLQSCTLQAPLTTGTLSCQPGSRIEFSPEGSATGCAPPGPPPRSGETWHYTLGEPRPGQQVNLCRDRQAALDLARIFAEKGPRAGYAALSESDACATRVASITPRAVLVAVRIPAGAGEPYTVSFVEVTTAAGAIEYLVTTRGVRP